MRTDRPVCSVEPDRLAAEDERTGPEEAEEGESERVTVVREKQRATSERDEQAHRRRHQHRHLDLSVAHGLTMPHPSVHIGWPSWAVR